MHVSNMGVKTILSFEPPAAHGAVVLLIRVDDLVPLQMVVVTKTLPTRLTSKPGTLTVLPLLVLLQQFPCSK